MPSAILSMMVYAIMAIAGGIGLIWQIKIAEVVAKVSAPILELLLQLLHWRQELFGVSRCGEHGGFGMQD